VKPNEVDNAVQPSDLRKNRLSLKVKLVLALPITLVVGYLVMAVAVFDFSKPAFAFGQATDSAGRPIAIGPRPRTWAYTPDKNWEGVYWKGREWPFIVFSPVCSWWRHHNGYVAPSA